MTLKPISNALTLLAASAILGACGGGGGGEPPVEPGTTAPGGLYVGYYQEDPVTNPEDPVPGVFSLNLPAGNGAFSGSMYFTYVGCQTSNVGIVGGTKTDAALAGTWSGTVDGLAQSGSYSGNYSQAIGSYSGTYSNAGGKQFRDLRPCIQYTIAPKGTWEMFPVETQVPAASLDVTVVARTVNWKSVGGAVFSLVYVLDEAVAKSTGNPVVWQALIAAGTSAVIPANVLLQPGKVYIAAVGVSDAARQRLAFGSRRFTQP